VLTVKFVAAKRNHRSSRVVFRHMDHPPQLQPDEMPNREELSRLARELLREMARFDASLAQRLRSRGIEAEDRASA
jgi:hypothetical protein